MSLMAFFTYIRYFFYLAYNWNPRIATHIIQKEIKGESKYGIHTTGADELHGLEKKGIDISHATIYMPASYDMLEDILEEISKYKPTHFLDIGCGKGRAMAVAAHYGFNKITGLDFSKELIIAAEENMRSVAKGFPSLSYKLINNDAFYYEIPNDVDCIFLFNPFDEMIMSAVLENIKKSLRQKTRTLFIIYLNPLHKNVFLNNGFKEIFYLKKIQYLEGCILKNKG